MKEHFYTARMSHGQALGPRQDSPVVPSWPTYPPAEWAGLILVQLDGLLGPLEAADTAGLLHLQPRAALLGVLPPACDASVCHASAGMAGECIIAQSR